MNSYGWAGLGYPSMKFKVKLKALKDVGI